MTVLMLTLGTVWAADSDPFRPSGSLASGEGTLQGESPFLLGEGLNAGVLASFAQDLAILEFEDGRQESLVRHTLPIEIQAGWTFADKARVELFLPIYGNVNAPVSEFQGAAVGDTRLQANVPVFAGSDLFRFGLVPRIELPTGNNQALVRRGFVMGMSLTASGKAASEQLGWVANAGASVSQASRLREVGLGSAIELLGGGWWSPSPGFRLGAEIDSQIGLVKIERTNTVATWHGFAQTIVPSGWGLTVGAGSGLIAGVGAPDYRMFGALTYAGRVNDRDKDGIPDKEDACPDVPEDLDGFEDTDGCPEADNDNDTLPDVTDQCPDTPEDFDGFEDEDGCPELDNDGDGVPDTLDKCPDIPGPKASNGCPDRDQDGLVDSEDACPDDPGPVELKGCPDRDGDGVPDYRDKCPDEPIPADADPATSDGCPRIAYISKGKIAITERVKFNSGKASIKAESYALLEAVAEVLLTSPSVRKVEVAGHTDNVGSEKYNQKLSERRAASVLKFLRGKGIAPNRLSSKGYGESAPTDTNRTASGKQNNRRVEFTILEQEEPEPILPPQATPTPTTPEPVDSIDNPWDAVPSAPDVAAPAPEPAKAKTPVEVEPEPSPADASAKSAREAVWDAAPTDLTNPWDEGDTTRASQEPGPASRLTIYLRGVKSAEVRIDGDLIPGGAPFERLPMTVGSHVLTVVDQDSGLNYEETIEFVTGAETIRVLPKKVWEEDPEPAPEPEPTKKRKGRRSKKR